MIVFFFCFVFCVLFFFRPVWFLFWSHTPRWGTVGGFDCLFVFFCFSFFFFLLSSTCARSIERTRRPKKNGKKGTFSPSSCSVSLVSYRLFLKRKKNETISSSSSSYSSYSDFLLFFWSSSPDFFCWFFCPLSLSLSLSWFVSFFDSLVCCSLEI